MKKIMYIFYFNILNMFFPRSIIEQQLQNYLLEPNEDRNTTDPIKWWFEVGKKSYPKLFNIALDYLAIPATSGNEIF